MSDYLCPSCGESIAVVGGQKGRIPNCPWCFARMELKEDSKDAQVTAPFSFGSASSLPRGVTRHWSPSFSPHRSTSPSGPSPVFGTGPKATGMSSPVKPSSLFEMSSDSEDEASPRFPAGTRSLSRDGIPDVASNPKQPRLSTGVEELNEWVRIQDVRNRMVAASGRIRDAADRLEVVANQMEDAAEKAEEFADQAELAAKKMEEEEDNAE